MLLSAMDKTNVCVCAYVCPPAVGTYVRTYLGPRQLLEDVVNDITYLVLVALDRHTAFG